MKIDPKKLIPTFCATGVALLVTLAVRFIWPPTESGPSSLGSDIPLPEVPFIEKKESAARQEAFVLITTKDIKQWEKIDSSSVVWKKWPKEAISSHFIAKDNEEKPLNDSGTYNSVINLLAKYPLIKGTPITMAHLSRRKPVEKPKEEKPVQTIDEQELRKKIETEIQERVKKEEEERKQQEEIAAREKELLTLKNQIKSGMRIITVQLDQRSTTSQKYLRIGDIVDLLFPIPASSAMFKKFRNVKVIAIDGNTEDSSANSVVPDIELLKNPPQNITVEIKEKYTEEILAEISQGRNAIVLVKNQEEVKKQIAIEESGQNKTHTQKKKENMAILNTAFKKQQDSSKENGQTELIKNEEKAKNNATGLLNKLFSFHTEEKVKKPDSMNHILQTYLKDNAVSPKKIEEKEDKNEAEQMEIKLPEGEVTIYKKTDKSVLQYDGEGKFTEATDAEHASPSAAGNSISSRILQNAASKSIRNGGLQ